MPSGSKLSRRGRGYFLIVGGLLLVFAVSLVLAGKSREFVSAVAVNPGAERAAQSAQKIQRVERHRPDNKAKSILDPLGPSVLSEVVTDTPGTNEETNSGVSLETVHHVSFGSPVIQIAGFDFDPENHPATGWGETSSNGGVNNFRWATRTGGWVQHTMDQPGGGIRAAQADFILREDGTPFFAYAIRDAFIFGQDWYTAHIVNLATEPTGHGVSVQPLDAGTGCNSSYPKFAMAFAPTAPAEPVAASPSFLLGTHCFFSGWLSLDNATIHGEPAFRAAAGTAGEFHSIDFDIGPLASHHITYYAERGGLNWGAYYSNGSPGQELLLAVPHRNRAAETSVAVGPDGRIHVAIGGVPLCGNTFEGGLLYLTSTDGVNWTRMFVDDISGRSPSITLDAVGNPHIAYWRQNTEVRLASLEANAWTTTPIFTATTPVVRASVKLAFDNDEQPHVLFFNPDASDIQMSSGVSSDIAPAVTNPGSMASEISQNISLQIAAADTENGPLSYRACNLPAGLSIDPNTGLIGGTITGSAATYAVTVTVADASGNTGSVSFNWRTIPAGSAYQLAFIVQPSNTNTPDAISPAVKVVVQDLFGNTLTDAVNSVSIAIANNPGGSSLSGTVTRPAIDGVATFDDLRLSHAGTGYTLQVSSDGLLSATSNAFNVIAPAVINVIEQILVTDEPALLPSAFISVNENIAVQDAPDVLPSAMIAISENISVLDTQEFPPSTVTPTGTNVTLQFENVTITFATVSASGFTSVTPIDPASAESLPNGFSLCAGCPAYEIITSATYTPPIAITITVPSVTDPVAFSHLKLLHGENGVLVDRTTAQNFNNKTVSGSVSSLSPFVIAQGLTPTAADGSISGHITDTNGNPLEGALVRMSGTQNRLTISDRQGKYHFDNVETNGFYTLTPSHANFTFSPSERSFSALGHETEAAFTASANATMLNPLDGVEFFVRQHYLDFLNREPDESGFNFWSDALNACGRDASCLEVKRINTSAAYFLSIEFQQTGYLVYRMHKAAFGNLPGAPVPVRFSEFVTDTRAVGQGVVVRQTGWEEVLENNRNAYATEFVQRQKFAGAYPATMTPAQFVDKLFANSGVTPSETDRSAVVNEFGSAATTGDAAARSRALRRVAENSVLRQQEFNRAFVLMEYFGYLRRDPDQSPDNSFEGYNFWLTKLNQFNGNFEKAEMVKAFINSNEYRRRFGP